MPHTSKSGFIHPQILLKSRKSKPVLVGAGVIWALVAVAYVQHGDTHTAESVFRVGLEQFIELFLFLLAAMTYVNAMSERGVFAALRGWLISRDLTLRQVYWMLGGLTFFISPLADNLTTALLMATVVVTVGGTNKRFVLAACISVVVAANAGGVFSPFGDITTLMVWQRGIVQFQDFFSLFVPALVNWLVPAAILSFMVPGGKPQADEQGGDCNKEHGRLLDCSLHPSLSPSAWSTFCICRRSSG